MVRHPEHAATIERVLQIGPKRHERALVTYLTEPELDALIDARHEQVETTQMYLHADLAVKERRWRAPSHWTADPVATARQTRSSDSWTDCEHVVSSLCFPRTVKAG
jgi:hypothetical protein